MIPVLIGSTPMPRSEDLPEPLVALSECNALRLADEGWDDQVARLITALERVVRTEPGHVPRPAAWGPARPARPFSPGSDAPDAGPSPTPSRQRWWAVPVGCGVAVVAALLLVAGLASAGVQVISGAVDEDGPTSSSSSGPVTTLAPVTTIAVPTVPPVTSGAPTSPSPPGTVDDDAGRGNPLIAISPTSGPPGTRVTVNGTGYGKGETVDVLFHANEVGTTLTRADGSFTLRVTIPPWPFRNRQFDILARGKRTIRHDSAPFQVL